jgi:hypothetical protein
MNRRSFHELVGSSESFPGQYHRGYRGGAIFHAAYTGLPLLSFLLFSTSQSRASVSAPVLPNALPVVTVKPAHSRHVQGFFRTLFAPLLLPGPTLHSFRNKASAREVHASTFQNTTESHAAFQQRFPPLPFQSTGEAVGLEQQPRVTCGFEGLLLPESCRRGLPI